VKEISLKKATETMRDVDAGMSMHKEGIIIAYSVFSFQQIKHKHNNTVDMNTCIHK